MLPSSRHAVNRSLRLPDLRTGEDSPLSTTFRRSNRKICRSQWLSTPRCPRSGRSATSPTRLPRFIACWPSRLRRETHVLICERLGVKFARADSAIAEDHSLALLSLHPAVARVEGQHRDDRFFARVVSKRRGWAAGLQKCAQVALANARPIADQKFGSCRGRRRQGPLKRLDEAGRCTDEEYRGPTHIWRIAAVVAFRHCAKERRESAVRPARWRYRSQERRPTGLGWRLPSPGSKMLAPAGRDGLDLWGRCRR